MRQYDRLTLERDNVEVLQTQLELRRAVLGDQHQRLGLNLAAIEEDSLRSLNDWLPEQHALNLAAWRELGFDDQQIAKELPEPDQLIRGLWPQEKSLVVAHSSAHIRPQFVARPLMRHIGLFGNSDNPGLYTRYVQRFGGKTVQAPKVWNALADNDRLHDADERGMVALGFLLNDDLSPFDRRSANTSTELGLAFAGELPKVQRELFEQERKDHAQAGRVLRLASIGDIIMVNAMRNIEGKPVLDTETYTRLVHYPETDIGVKTPCMVVPEAASHNGELILGIGKVAGGNWSKVGVRRVLSIDVFGP